MLSRNLLLPLLLVSLRFALSAQHSSLVELSRIARYDMRNLSNNLLFKLFAAKEAEDGAFDCKMVLPLDSLI